MNLTPEKIKRTRVILKGTQVALVTILLMAIWANAHINVWQKVLATALAVFLLSVHIKEFIARQNKK